jgi:signal transduction histidine kinase
MRAQAVGCAEDLSQDQCGRGAPVVSVGRVLSRVGRVWAWIQSHPLAADAALAAVLLGVALVSSRATIEFFRQPSLREPDAAGLAALLAAVVLPLALRRRIPLTVLLASTAAYVALGLVLGPLISVEPISIVALSLAIYSGASHGGARWRTWVCGVCLVAIIVLKAHFLPSDLPLLMRVFQVFVSVALFGALWALGAALGSGRRRAKELLQRTTELEHEREENARRAVFDERVRIARELHDVVAHHVSMMGVQAGAARVVLGRDLASAKKALTSVEASSRQAVLELHRLLGFLRQADDPDDLAPQPGLDQLPRLATSMSGSELTVEVRVAGEQRSLPPTVDVSAYRIVQEALTNTLKHASASRADVHLRYWPDELELEIVDDGRGDGAASNSSGGLGLIGMRERAALHGGQLTAGPAAGGGFVVRVRLPTPTGAL